MRGIFRSCSELKELNLLNFDTSNVVIMSNMFELCNKLEQLDLSNFDTSNVNDMKFMFNSSAKLKKIKGIENFKTYKVKNMTSMFQLCTELEELDLSNFDTSNLNGIKYMFNECTNIKIIKGIEHFKTDKVKDMTSLFRLCHKLEYLDLLNFNTSKVTNFNFMLCECFELNKIKGIEKFNTRQLVDMEGMFLKCSILEELDLSNFDTSKVKNMAIMFRDCKEIKIIKGIERFNTNQVTNMEGMFYNCLHIQNLNLSNFDTSNATNIKYMFNNCRQLRIIKGIERFNTSQVINMEAMFLNCSKLEELNLSNFDTSKTCSMAYMFNGCTNIKRIKGIENYNTSKVTNMKCMFQDCIKLEELDLTNFDISNLTNYEDMFYGINDITIIKGVEKFL